MRVRVLFFGVLKDLTGLASDSPELPEHATLADMLEYYERKLGFQTTGKKIWAASLVRGTVETCLYTREREEASQALAA